MSHRALIDEFYEAMAEKERIRDDLRDEVNSLARGSGTSQKDYQSLESEIKELDLQIEVIREKIHSLQEDEVLNPNKQEYFTQELPEVHNKKINHPKI